MPTDSTPTKIDPQPEIYRKAKAEPEYRFWSLYGELTRRDLLEHALRLVVRNGGAPGVDGQKLDQITATPERQACWLDALQRELQTRTYRPAPVRRKASFMPRSIAGPQTDQPNGVTTPGKASPTLAVLQKQPFADSVW